MEFKNYYEVMGLKRDATQDEIKRSYRKLARKYHPDVSKEADAEARFKELGEAYEVLKDPEKRTAYDQLGANWQGGQDFHPPPDWDQGFEYQGGGFTPGDSSQFSDFFESLFGGGFASHGQARGGAYSSHGNDTHAKVVIDLQDAYVGATRAVTLRHSKLGADGRPEIKNRTLNVRIPKGVRQGQHIRLAGQGGSAVGQGKPGDLYLEVEFNPHEFYRIEGRDVYLDLPVAPWEAVLGAKIKVPTPEGLVELKIPPSSQTGKRMRLKNKGIPGDHRGDLYVILQVILPPADSDEAKALYHEMEQKLAFNPRDRLGV